MSVIYLGSDPELFARDAATGLVTSLAGRLGADKYNKRHVTEDVRIQEDNVLIEFDINPHGTFDGFNANMARGLQLCDEAARQVGSIVDPSICSHVFSDEELRTFHKDAFVFGCEPDFNALTGMRNAKPAAADAGLRTAGGHIHIGFNEVREVDSESQKVLGVMCDYFLGLPAILLDKDDRRKELYGKAGACRFKQYGIEYRVLSNFWTQDDASRLWAWEQAHKAFNFMTGDAMMLAAIVDPEEIQRVINQNDKQLAEHYITLLEIM